MRARLSMALFWLWLAGLCTPALSATAAVQVRYMLWDASQLPAYRQCAADFQQQHPDIRIRIRQVGFGDYWTVLATGFLSDTAPDVFVNHLSRYPELVRHGLLQDLTPWMARDGIDTRPYPSTLVTAWAREGHQYGLPKDWDTVALMVNLAHARRQGVSLQALQQMQWNPQDGGSFEQIVRQLTVDEQGRNATHPQFDRTRVAMYGYQTPGPGGMSGQTEWSHFAASAGFRFQDAPWLRPLHYDHPALASTLDYLATLPDKGLSARPERIQGLGASALFVAGRVAMLPDGAWMAHHYHRNARFAHAWVALPRGPEGYRATMLNGSADSLWAGSRVKPQAWLWMQYLASAPCQAVVARSGVVFPAIQALANTARQAQRQAGIDTTAFIMAAQGPTFAPPVADRASEIDDIVGRAIESVLRGQSRAAPALKEASERVRRLQR